MKERKVDISINWIKSHNGHVGNERADILAGIGSSTSQQHSLVNSIEISQVKGYWKSEYERNPYVAFRRLYFNSISEYNQPGIYHLAESTETDFIIGKPSASTCYSVVYLKDHDPIIEMIKQKQFKISRGINVIVLMKLDSVYSRHVYPWLNHYGENTILRQGNTHSMTLVDKKPITVEIYPTGLSMRSLDYFAMLEEILVWFNEPRTNNIDLRVGAYKITTHSITDRFFKLSTDKKGKTKHELLPEFIVGYKNMMMDIKISYKDAELSVRIPYVLGYDCLPRNNLKHLEHSNPTISLLTWVEGQVLRYCTIINSNYGTGIWSNYFANQVLLPA